MKNKNLYFLIFILFFTSSCQSLQDSLKTNNDDSPNTINNSSEPKATIEQVKVAHNLIKIYGNDIMLKRILYYHNLYYLGLHQDLDDLLATTADNLKNHNLKDARKRAIKNMEKDADLMDEIKQYVASISNDDNNNSLIRFSYNRTPLILRTASKLLSNDNYFNAIVSGQYFNKFDWHELTFLGGIDNIDEKGTITISALTASLIYLLDDEELSKNLHNHGAIIYNESITDTLAQNPKLLTKIQKNYHLFSANGNVVSKVYEAYEFGGNKDLKPINNPNYVPFDCSTGISHLVNITKNQFSTNHLSSYYDEFFEQNSTYWKFSDWKKRREIIENLTPVKFSGLATIRPGTILVMRNLTNQKSLLDPEGYVGSAGHVAVVLGANGDDLYYISWERDLEAENKSGLGIDVLSIAKTEQKVAAGKMALFGYELKKN